MRVVISTFLVVKSVTDSCVRKDAFGTNFTYTQSLGTAPISRGFSEAAMLLVLSACPISEEEHKRSFIIRF